MVLELALLHKREFPGIDDMATDAERIKATVIQLVHWLATENYPAIENHSHGIRLSEDLLRAAVGEYGGKIVMPPSIVFENIDTVLVAGSDPKKWSVRFDLWTERDGRSDLSLECTLIDGKNELLDVEIDNLHVL